MLGKGIFGYILRHSACFVLIFLLNTLVNGYDSNNIFWIMQVWGMTVYVFFYESIVFLWGTKRLNQQLLEQNEYLKQFFSEDGKELKHALFSIQVNHEIIVEVKEIKRLLWDVQCRLAYREYNYKTRKERESRSENVKKLRRSSSMDHDEHGVFSSSFNGLPSEIWN